MKRAYTSLHSGTDRERDLVTALKWAQDQAEDDQQVTLWCAHRDALPDGWEPRLRKAGIEVVAERPRRRGGSCPRHFDGPLVAVGFTMLDDVIDVEPFQHPMCLVGAYDPRNDEHFDILDDHPHVRWVQAFEPECLAGPPIAVPEPLIEDPVVAKAMESFNSITFGGKTLYDSRDGGRVTDGLMLCTTAVTASTPNGSSPLPFGRVGRAVRQSASGRSRWKWLVASASGPASGSGTGH